MIWQEGIEPTATQAVSDVEVCCGGDALKPIETAGPTCLAAQDLAHLENQKVFFGHQSVGDDIVHGIRDLMASDPRLKLHIVESADPQQVPGPAFVETHIGRNGDPQSKAEAFRTIMDRGMGKEGGIALYKYCYVDVGPATDIQKMFDEYRHGVDSLKLKYPLLRIVHVTIPLTTVEPAIKVWVKSALGRVTARDINRKRDAYNQLLAQAYCGEPIFDLAEIESTCRNGLRSESSVSRRQVPALNPKLTTDGGHLNESGRRTAARHLLLVLAKLGAGT